MKNSFQSLFKVSPRTVRQRLGSPVQWLGITRTPEAASELDTDLQLNPDYAKFHDSLRQCLSHCDICVSACPLSPPLFTSSRGPRKHLAASLEERQTWSEVGDLGQIGLTWICVRCSSLTGYLSVPWLSLARPVPCIVTCGVWVGAESGECHWLTKSP